MPDICIYVHISNLSLSIVVNIDRRGALSFIDHLSRLEMQKQIKQKQKANKLNQHRSLKPIKKKNYKTNTPRLTKRSQENN